MSGLPLSQILELSGERMIEELCRVWAGLDTEEVRANLRLLRDIPGELRSPLVAALKAQTQTEQQWFSLAWLCLTPDQAE